jgi:Rieske Fe-S protein
MSITRRQFFGVGVTTAAGGSVAVLLRFLWPSDTEKPPVTRIAAADLPGPDDDPLSIRVGAARAYVVAVAETDVLALLRKCTNEGCTVAWRRERHTTLGDSREQVFRCVCCGSAYTRSGTPVFGPAPAPLQPLPLEQHSDGDVFVSLPERAERQRGMVPR